MSSREEKHSKESLIQDEKQRDGVQRHTTAFYLAIAAVCISFLMSSIDTVIVASALPRIAEALHASSIETYWCGTGFLYAQAVAQPIYGTFIGIVGAKYCIMAAMSVFLVASIFCAAAQSITWLITARVVQGIGGGGVNAMVIVIISAMVPLEDRGTYVGIVSLCGAVGLVSGVVMGAAISERASWRIVFYINIPISSIALIGLALFLKLPKPRVRWQQQVKKVDWIGLTILTGSIISLLYGITGGNVLYPWKSPHILVPLVVGGLGVGLFVLYEARFATDAIIPLRVFSTRTAASGYYMTFIHALILWAFAYYMNLYFIIAQRHSLLGAAVATLPGMAVVPPVAAAAGVGIALTKRFVPFNLAAWIILPIGLGLFSTLDANSTHGAQFGYQTLTAIGGGIVFSGRLLAVQAPQRRAEDIPMATTLVSLFTSLGQSFGLGIGGTIFQNSWNAELDKQIALGRLQGAEIILARDVENAALLIRRLPEGVQEAYAIIVSKSLRVLWITLAALAVSACLATTFQRNLSTAAQQSRGEENETNNERLRDGLDAEQTHELEEIVSPGKEA